MKEAQSAKNKSWKIIIIIIICCGGEKNEWKLCGAERRTGKSLGFGFSDSDDDDYMCENDSAELNRMLYV